MQSGHPRSSADPARSRRRRNALRAAGVVVAALVASSLLVIASLLAVDGPVAPVPAQAARIPAPDPAPSALPTHGPLLTDHARMIMSLMDHEEGHGTIVCWVGDILPDGSAMSTGPGFTMAMVTEGWLWASTVTPDGSTRARAEEPYSALVTWEGVAPGEVGACTVSERREAAGLYGQVTGWDGTGELAAEGCGCGAEVAPDTTWACAAEAGDCAMRTVMWRGGMRAYGPQVPVEIVPGQELEVTLSAPDPQAFAPIPLAQLSMEREMMEIADRFLHVGKPDPEMQAQMEARWNELEVREQVSAQAQRRKERDSH